MPNRKEQEHANALLDRLIEIDFQTVEAYYDMGSIISSMQHGKLHKVIGYNSMTELVEEELTYSPASAFKYATMYRHFRRLHYMKHEAIDLLKKFGLTHLSAILPTVNTKIGARAIKARIDNLDQHQLNFTLTKAELDKAHTALKKFGLIRQGNDGRWLHSSDAFMEMVTQFTNGKTKKVA